MWVTNEIEQPLLSKGGENNICLILTSWQPLVKKKKVWQLTSSYFGLLTSWAHGVSGKIDFCG